MNVYCSLNRIKFVDFIWRMRKFRYLIFSNWHKQWLTQYTIFQPKAHADMTKCYLVWYRQQCKRVEINQKYPMKRKKNSITNLSDLQSNTKPDCIVVISFHFCFVLFDCKWNEHYCAREFDGICTFSSYVLVELNIHAFCLLESWYKQRLISFIDRFLRYTQILFCVQSLLWQFLFAINKFVLCVDFARCFWNKCLNNFIWIYSNMTIGVAL